MVPAWRSLGPLGELMASLGEPRAPLRNPWPRLVNPWPRSVDPWPRRAHLGRPGPFWPLWVILGTFCTSGHFGPKVPIFKITPPDWGPLLGHFWVPNRAQNRGQNGAGNGPKSAPGMVPAGATFWPTGIAGGPQGHWRCGFSQRDSPLAKARSGFQKYE